MAITARGYYSSAVDAVRTMLSNSTHFQKVCQVASAADALAKIVLHSGETLARPYAHVMMSEPDLNRIAGGVNEYFWLSQKLAIEIELPVTFTGTVTTAGDADSFTASALAGFEDDHFNGLTLMMTSGTGNGESAVISDYTGATGAIELTTPLAHAPALTNTFRIYATTRADEEIFELNIIGDIVADLVALCGTGGYPGFANVRLVASGRPQQDREEDDYWGAVLEVACD